MHSTAMGWLVWRLTGSATLLGTVGFINMLPPLIFSYPAGVIADRIDIKKGLKITQLSAFILASLVAILTLTGLIKIWHILIIGFILGMVGSFDMPFRQSFVIQIVPKNILHNAIALNSVMFNISRIIGPAVAGFVVRYWGEGYCFLINALSYLAIIFALTKIIPQDLRKTNSSDFLNSFLEGINYIKNTSYIRYPILHMFMLSFVIMPVITMMPVYVTKLNGDAQTLGFFMSAIGIGAVIGGISLASKKIAKNYARMVNFFSTIYGLSLFLLSFSISIYLSAVFLFLAGIGTSRQAVGLNTIIQTLVKENVRGRVISVYSLSFMGLAPFGNLLWGYITNRYGISFTLILCSCWVIIANIIFYKNILVIKKKIGEIKGDSIGEFDIL